MLLDEVFSTLRCGCTARVRTMSPVHCAVRPPRYSFGLNHMHTYYIWLTFGVVLSVFGFLFGIHTTLPSTTHPPAGYVNAHAYAYAYTLQPGACSGRHSVIYQTLT